MAATYESNKPPQRKGVLFDILQTSDPQAYRSARLVVCLQETAGMKSGWFVWQSDAACLLSRVVCDTKVQAGAYGFHYRRM